MYADIAACGNGVGRFTPTWTAAPGGGAFICFTSADFGEVTDVGAGSRCAVTTDTRGDLHVAYDNGGLRYRKVSTRCGRAGTTWG